jgi:metal-dependent hydrolase (beta-lactamase superfamily II)
MKTGATHCSGPQAMTAFQDAYQEDFFPMGVGRIIRLPLP